MSRRRVRAHPCHPSLLQGNPTILRPPKDTAPLGLLLELEHRLPDGQVVRHSWETRDAPLLFWQEQQQAIYAFAKLKLPPSSQHSAGNLPPGAADAFHRWHGERKRATKKFNVKVPAIEMRRAGEGLSILYRSDKFGPVTNYIHPFDEGVEVDLSPGRPPAVFYIRGANLRLTPRGLEG